MLKVLGLDGDGHGARFPDSRTEGRFKSRYSKVQKVRVLQVMVGARLVSVTERVDNDHILARPHGRRDAHFFVSAAQGGRFLYLFAR